MGPTRNATEVIIWAREYLRVSQDKSKVGRSTDEQHDDNERAAADHRWSLGEPYRDNNRSASRYATKAREDFDQLIADLQADRFGADVLLLWESSRGSRKVSEWVTLIELCEQRSVKIHVTTHGRTYDPSNARDRRSLLEDSVDSEYDAAKISIRTRRGMNANAEAGRPHGRVPYGYRRRYDPETKRFIAQEEKPTEAANVRELFDRIVTGHSLRSIARDWAERGFVNKSGKPFTAEHLRSIARTRLYCGEREHTPGRKGRARPDQPTTYVKGRWEPIVPKATWLAVQRILSAPERRTSRPGRGIHFLSMIVPCDVCSGPMIVRYRTKEPQYVCQNGHVRISEAELDDYAEDVILDYLAEPGVYEEMSSGDDDNEALAKAQEEVAAAQEELDKLVAAYNAKQVTLDTLIKTEPVRRADLKAAQDREAELRVPHKLRGLIEPGKGVRARWGKAPMSTRREVARLLFVPDKLGELRVCRPPSRRSEVEDRVRWEKPE